MTKKDDNSTKSDWDDVTFDAISLPKKEDEEVAVKKKSIVKTKSNTLTLDESGMPKTKTRTEMASDIIYNIEDDKDLMNYAPVAIRAIAGVLDYAYLYGLYLFAVLINPYMREIVRYVMDKYKQQFIFPEPSVLQGILVVDLVLMGFFLVVIPLSFYNITFGKVLLGLRVRGPDKYTLSIIQSFQREFIFKPLSTASIIGIAWALFSKERLTLHDKAAQTVVVTK